MLKSFIYFTYFGVENVSTFQRCSGAVFNQGLVTLLYLRPVPQGE